MSPAPSAGRRRARRRRLRWRLARHGRILRRGVRRPRPARRPPRRRTRRGRARATRDRVEVGRAAGADRGAARPATISAAPAAVEEVRVVEVRVHARRQPAAGPERRARSPAPWVVGTTGSDGAVDVDPAGAASSRPRRPVREVAGPGAPVACSRHSRAPRMRAATSRSVYQPPPQKSVGATPRSRSQAPSRRTRCARVAAGRSRVGRAREVRVVAERAARRRPRAHARARARRRARPPPRPAAA